MEELIWRLMGWWETLLSPFREAAQARRQQRSTEVHEAAKRGDLETIIRLAANNPHVVRAKDPYDHTPLHEAATVEVAQWLLERGARVNARGWMGATPLHRAAQRGAVNVAALLIRSGAAVTAERDRGDVPLHWAANAATAQLLLENGAAVEARDVFGRTPLHWAAQFGHADVVRVLLQHGADAGAPSESGETPLHWAAREGHAEVAACLLNAGAPIDATDTDRKDTPLHEAAWRRHVAVVELLLTQGASPHLRNAGGETAFHMLVKGREEDVQALLARRPELSAAPLQPMAGPVVSDLVRPHPLRVEAVTAVRHGALATWTNEPGGPRRQAFLQTEHSRINDIAVSPDGEWLAIVGSGNAVEIRRWNDLELAERIVCTQDDDPDAAFVTLTAVTISPDGRWLAVADSRESLWLIHLASGSKHFLDSEGGEWTGSVAFDSASQLLAAACSFQGGAGVNILCVDESGRAEEYQYASRSDRETPSRDFVNELPALTFSPNSCSVAVFESSRYESDRGRLALLDVQNGTPRWVSRLRDVVTADNRFADGNGPVTGFGTEVRFRGESEVICGSPDGHLLVYDTLTGVVRCRVCVEASTTIPSLALDASGDLAWVVLGSGELVMVPVAKV